MKFNIVWYYILFILFTLDIFCIPHGHTQKRNYLITHLTGWAKHNLPHNTTLCTQHDKEYIWAIRANDYYLVDLLLKYGVVDINTTSHDYTQWTPLQEVAYNNAYATAKILIHYGAHHTQINHPSIHDHETPLMIALGHGASIKLIHLLLKHGADSNIYNHIVNIKNHIDTQKQTSLMILAENQHHDINHNPSFYFLTDTRSPTTNMHLAQLLLYYGADPSLRDFKNNMTVVEIAQSKNNTIIKNTIEKYQNHIDQAFLATKTNNINALKKIALHITLRLRDQHNDTLLHHAIYNQHWQVTTFLITIDRMQLFEENKKK